MSSSQSYFPNYFSINDILATEERILCQVEVPLPGLGKYTLKNYLNIKQIFIMYLFE